MKLIVPVYDDNRIAEGFNRTPDVCIFDPMASGQEGVCTFVPWRTIIPPGSKITKKMKEMGIEAVLTSQIQLLALNLFVENGINVYKSSGDDLTYNLSLYIKQELMPYTAIEALENSSICSGSCDSCESDDKCEK
ncbi:hypothetical protein [uncultured Bacteroides sp.]|uniref:NifB/NifX family molybdenum-iron cluster-binding protein n=1 Tax=uncultured Bacteroides sp. TaxID=162156 RepID=UPI002AA5F559|nr:hypothetical protein [uncultured Bacteroides sp.]